MGGNNSEAINKSVLAQLKILCTNSHCWPSFHTQYGPNDHMLGHQLNFDDIVRFRMASRASNTQMLDLLLPLLWLR